MNRKYFMSFLAIFIVCCLTTSAYALNYCENRYYNAKIFIQNELDDYTSYFEDAVDARNNAGVIDREVVVNTSSSSYIHNCSFSDSNSYWEEYYSNAHGTYYATSTLSYACSCHVVTSFVIALNDDKIDHYNYAYESDMSKAVQSLICHELGHAFGLIDFYGSQYQLSSVMNTDRDVLNIYTPQTNDKNNANDCWEPHRN